MSEKILKKSAFVIVIIIIGKIFAFIRDILVTYNFGSSYQTDIYLFAIGLIYLLTTLSYGLTTTIIPVQSEMIMKKSKGEADIFISNLINISTLITITITIIGIIFSKYSVILFAPGFRNNAYVFNSSVQLIRIMLVSLVFINLQSVITGVLQAHNQFYEPAAMAAVSSLIAIFYLLFLVDRYGIIGFSVTTVIGFLAQLIINLPKFKKLGYRYKFYIKLNDKRLKKLFLMMVPIIISTSVVQLNVFVNRNFATYFGEGAVTILDLSNKINILIYEVFAIAISMIVYPMLSKSAGKIDKTDYKNSLNKAVNIILLITIPAAIALAILSVPVVSIIFKRGKFDQTAAFNTAKALTLYCPSMIAYGVRDILNKAFYAIEDSINPMVNSFIGIIINILLNIILSKYMGVSGLTLATSISMLVVTVFLILKLNKKLEGISLNSLFNVFMKVMFASLIMGGVVYFINKAVLNYYGYTNIYFIVSILLSFVIGSLIYFGLIIILKIDEIKFLTQYLKKR